MNIYIWLHYRELVYAVVNRGNTFLVKNVPRFMNHRETNVAMNTYYGSQFTSIGNWIVAIGSNGMRGAFTILDVNWKTVYAGPPPQFLHTSQHMVTATSNFIYVFDGRYNEVFEVATGRWSRLPDLNFTVVYNGWIKRLPLNNFRAVCPVPDDRVFIYCNESYLLRRIPQETEGVSTDPQGAMKNHWSLRPLPDMVRQRDRSASAYFDGRIFVAGGNVDHTVDIECLALPKDDSDNCQWTLISTSNLFPLTFGKQLLSLNGKLFFVCDRYVFEYSPQDPNKKELNALGEMWNPMGEIGGDIFACLVCVKPSPTPLPLTYFSPMEPISI